MIYTSYDFITLETKTDSELKSELEQAKENYEYVQALFSSEESDNPFEQGNNIPLNILFSHLNLISCMEDSFLYYIKSKNLKYIKSSSIIDLNILFFV